MSTFGTTQARPSLSLRRSKLMAGVLLTGASFSTSQHANAADTILVSATMTTVAENKALELPAWDYLIELKARPSRNHLGQMSVIY